MKKSWLALSLLMLGACTTQYSFAADQALIVGVGQYQNPSANLPGIEKDVAMAQQLVAHMGFEAKNIKLLQDQQATREQFRAALKQLAQTTQPNDRVIIYISSHGSQVKDTNGDEEDGYDETLYLHDDHFVDDEFGELLDKIPSENMVVLLDACHSGTGTKALPPNSLTSTNTIQTRVKAWNIPLHAVSPKSHKKNLSVEAVDATDGQRYIAIGAAQDNQYAQATSEGSLFTKALLTSFENARSNKQDISWQNLFDATSQQLARALQGVDPSMAFQPQMTGSPALFSRTIRFNSVNSSTTSYNPLWQETLDTVQSAAQSLKIEVPDTLKKGDKVSISIDVPQAGYLNVISINPNDEAELLFPNQYAQDNAVKVETIQIPQAGKFVLRANPPFGKHLVAAFLTTQPINLQKNALGNRDSKGQINKLIAQLPLSSVRALGRSKDESNGRYIAGYRIIDITEK